MDYEKAFKFVFDDKDWVKKIIIGGLLSIAAFVIIPIFFVLGYYIEVEQRAAKGNMILPEWDNWGEKLRKGFSVYVVFLVYLLPAVLLIGILVTAIIIISALSASNGPNDAAGALFAVLILFGYAFYFFYILLFTVIMPVIIVQYGRTESIRDAINVKKIFNIVKENFVQILILVAFAFLANFVGSLGMIALFVGVFFTSFYAQLVLYNLYGQFGKALGEK